MSEIPLHPYEGECAHARTSCGPGCPCTCADCTVARLVRERDEARNRLTAAHRHIDRLSRVVYAARLFRKADTGGSFNDRVETGALLDDKLAALDAADHPLGCRCSACSPSK